MARATEATIEVFAVHAGITLCVRSLVQNRPRAICCRLATLDGTGPPQSWNRDAYLARFAIAASSATRAASNAVLRSASWEATPFRRATRSAFQARMATSWAVLIALASVVFMDPTVPLREPQCESSYALLSSDARRCAVGMENSGVVTIGTAGPLSPKTTTRFPDSEAVLRCRPPTVSCNDRAIDMPGVIRCKE